jgi:hypothetical protein
VDVRGGGGGHGAPVSVGEKKPQVKTRPQGWRWRAVDSGGRRWTAAEGGRGLQREALRPVLFRSFPGSFPRIFPGDFPALSSFLFIFIFLLSLLDASVGG